MPEFVGFPKIPRLNRNMLVTEKIDGTNAAVGFDADGNIHAQSRKRIITPEDDNYGFARWAYENKEQLFEALGEGLHFGEWWGSGIQRQYGLKNGEKYFSLFNTSRFGATLHWEKNMIEGLNLRIVPVIKSWTFDNAVIDEIVEGLSVSGSLAMPGFMDAEGVCVFLAASRSYFKVTCKNDTMSKGEAEALV